MKGNEELKITEVRPHDRVFRVFGEREFDYLINVTKTMITFSSGATSLLRIANGSRVIFGYSGNVLLISNVSNIGVHGYTVKEGGSYKRSHIRMPSTLKLLGIEVGLYEVDEQPLFVRGKTWYEYKKITDEQNERIIDKYGSITLAGY